MTRKPKPKMAEVLYMDDQGIWHVLQLHDMSDKILTKLLEHEYGIKREWVCEIRRKPVPKRYDYSRCNLSEGVHHVNNNGLDRSSRRFLPTGEFTDRRASELN